MSSLLAGPSPVGVKDEKDAGRALESLLVKQLLQTSGVFKGSGAAGSALHGDLFAEAIAEAVVAQGGFGVGDSVAKSLTSQDGVTSPPPPEVPDVTSFLSAERPGEGIAKRPLEPSSADRSVALKVYRSRADE
jgi:hypothetical protein